MKPSLTQRALMAAYAMLALLTSCETPGAKEIEIREVKIPIATHPIKAEDVPAPPAPLGPRQPTLRQSADQLLAGYCLGIAYMLKADPLLRLSAGMPAQPLAAYPECGDKGAPK